MPKYRATVQLVELNGADRVAVRQEIEARIESAGFPRWRIVSIDPDPPEGRRPVAPPASTPSPRDAVAPPQPVNFGGLLLIGAVAWVIWLVWTLAG